jgi:ribosomal protein S18 acetylase RimI-like enzyme
MSSSTSRHDIGRVVTDQHGTVLAYALVSEPQPGVAHIELLGTRRQARGRGLARAVLMGTLRAAREASFAVVELEVDSTSPTGADRLYASVGFAPVRTISRYVRDVA